VDVENLSEGVELRVFKDPAFIEWESGVDGACDAAYACV